MITYPVNPLSKWTVYQVSTGQTIKRGKSWPRLDGGPVIGWFDTAEGLETEDHRWLEEVNGLRPDYDSRLFTLQSTETVNPPDNRVDTIWAAIARPSDERIAAAENEESAQLNFHLKVERELIETRLMVAAILAYVVDNQQFPPKVRTMANAYVLKGQKLFQNRDRLEAIKAQILAGQEPDLDAGWAAP